MKSLKIPIFTPKNVIHPIHCIPLHGGQYMSADARVHTDIGMTKNFLYDFRVDIYSEQNGRH